MTYEETNNWYVANEIDILRRFRSSSGLAFSAYLDLRCTYLKKNVLNILNELVQRQLRDSKISRESEQDMKEDMELIELHLQTNNNLNAVGIVIFSCAPKLFWRAIPVCVPIEMNLHIGSELNIDPLLKILESQNISVGLWEAMAV